MSGLHINETSQASLDLSKQLWLRLRSKRSPGDWLGLIFWGLSFNCRFSNCWARLVRRNILLCCSWQYLQNLWKSIRYCVRRFYTNSEKKPYYGGFRDTILNEEILRKFLNFAKYLPRKLLSPPRKFVTRLPVCCYCLFLLAVKCKFLVMQQEYTD